MLISADLAGTAAQYGYDGHGHRLQAARAGTATRYVLDVAGAMSQVLMETASDGTAHAYYVYGNGVLLYKVLADNSSYFYHFDGIGSTVAMTDASENVVNHYAYSPYGLVLNQTEGVENRFQYVGSMGVMDEHDGLMFMRARYYDSLARRFISTDPVAYDGSFISRYAYVQGNPITRVDPSGDVWLQVAGALIGAGVNAYRNWDAWQSGGMSNSQFAASVALGAATGVLSTLGGASLAASALAGGASAAINNAGGQMISGGNFNWRETASAGAIGAAFGALSAELTGAGGLIIKYNKNPLIPPTNYSEAGGLAGFIAGTAGSKP